jgi:FlaA1/EpsC-like NDP-sugar epimerase
VFKVGVEGKTILITGGSGSIGQTLALKLQQQRPHAIRIFGNSENELFEMQHSSTFSAFKNMRYLLGDVRDKERVERAMEHTDVVFHLAALKHVMSSEYNPFEAVKTNVVGSQNVIDAALDKEVEKVIFTSSDKAANPTNVMGATKLLAEKLFVSANYYKGPRKTVFSSVRFGNVLDTRGSVIPLFKKQISEGGPVTITEWEMTRFVMSVNQATELVLEACEKAKGAEVFVLKMPAMRVRDLFEVMVEECAPTCGRKPQEIGTKVIGAKPGEKQYEELMTEEEAQRSLELEHMFVILPQITELMEVNKNAYAGAKKPSLSKGYTSRDTHLLSKQELKDLFYREKIFEEREA